VSPDRVEAEKCRELASEKRIQQGKTVERASLGKIMRLA
jgi:hypothetical protein